MEFSITYRGDPVGSGRCRAVRGGLEVTAHCAVRTDAVLRLFGLGSDGRALRIGVLEPAAGALTLQRVLSDGTLRQAGFSAGAPPTVYVLSDTAERPAPDVPTAAAETDVTLAEQTPAPDHPAEQTAAQPPRTGDPLIDTALAAGLVQAVPMDGGWTVSCPFVPGAACALQFALPACAVRAGRAVLHLRRDTPTDPP